MSWSSFPAAKNRWFLLAVVVLATGCVGPRCPDICFLTATIQGQVRGPDGRGVVNATVSVEVLDRSCAIENGSAGSFITDSAGDYGGGVEGISLGEPGCLVVSVEPNALSGLAGATDTVLAMFALPGERPSITRVDIALSATGPS